MKKLNWDELEEIFKSYSQLGIGGTNCRLMGLRNFLEAYEEIIRKMEND